MLFEQANFTCEQCGKQARRLTVHHIDGCGLNNNLINLVVLCSSCHSPYRSPEGNRATQVEMEKKGRHSLKGKLSFPSGRPKVVLTREYIRSEYSKAHPRA